MPVVIVRDENPHMLTLQLRYRPYRAAVLGRKRPAVQSTEAGIKTNFPTAAKTLMLHGALVRGANTFRLLQLPPEPPTENIRLQQVPLHSHLGAEQLPRARVHIGRPKEPPACSYFQDTQRLRVTHAEHVSSFAGELQGK